MDTKIPTHLKAYLKKGNETKPKENKMIYPTYKPDQPEIIVVKKNKKRKSKKGKKEKSDSKADIVIHKYKDEYPHIAYIPYSIPQMSAPNFPQQFPQQQQQQQFPPQFRDNRAYNDNRAFAQNFYYGMPMGFPPGQPIPMGNGEIPMEPIFPQRQPQPYQFVNVPMNQPLNIPNQPLQIEDEGIPFMPGYAFDIPMENIPPPPPPLQLEDAEIPMLNMFPFRSSEYSLVNNPSNIQPLNRMAIEDYQVEQNLPNIPIPRQNPILPDIPLEPVRVEQVSGRRRIPDPIPDEPEPNSSERVFDVELDNRPPKVSRGYEIPDFLALNPPIPRVERPLKKEFDARPYLRFRADHADWELDPTSRPEPVFNRELQEIQLPPSRFEERRPENELVIPEPIFDMIPIPDSPVVEESRPENELLSQQDLEEMFLEQQRRAFEMAKREDIGISPRPPSPPNTPQSSIAERIDRRRENPGRPREPLSQEEAQLIGSYIEIINTIPPKNRTPEQIDLLKRGEIVYKSKRRNHKEEVEGIKKGIEELVAKEGRQYRKKK